MREWLLFAFTGLTWGSSFFWIKTALDEIGPNTITFYRMLLGTIGLVFTLKILKKPFPRGKSLQSLGIMAIANPCVPLLLVAWSQTRIESGVASILNSTVPLFIIVLAHWFIGDEKITRAKILGLVTGFGGVVVLMSRDVKFSGLAFENILGQLAVLFASFLYAVGTVYSRRKLRNFNPVAQAAGIMFWSSVFSLPAALVAEWPLRIPHQMATWVSILWLGFFSSCVTFITYFMLLNRWGATRSSMVNYVLPVVGLTLGLLFRGESADWRLFLGTSMIFSGIVIVNFKV